ncbi:hypothetical protein SAY86_028640 [Trapa natans]|uniref:Uncharacterized protein n=1 Tax=Trapa natans TaxID=22666 RepID=A0AAN7M0Y0_TRANT|nr:hypothetical protein SAY86_028640 [Trapa natans]
MPRFFVFLRDSHGAKGENVNLIYEEDSPFTALLPHLLCITHCIPAIFNPAGAERQTNR